MSYGSQDPTTSNSTTTTQASPIYLPGQTTSLASTIPGLQAFVNGNLSASPQYSLLNQGAQDAASTSAAQQYSLLSSAPGVSAPAKAASGLQLGNTAVQSGASGATSSVKDLLSQWFNYIFASPSIGVNTQATSTSGGGGGTSASLCCFIFLEADNLTNEVRRFRDHHFYRGSLVDGGYRWMASHLVPMMKSHSWLKVIVRTTMTLPLAQVAKWVDGDRWGAKLVPIAYFWIAIWSICGRLANGPSIVRSRSMTRTFVNRLIGR